MPSLDQYYSRFDPALNYEEHMFRAGQGLQSAELNEVQQNGNYRLKAVGDALFKDGDIIRDCQCFVDPVTGDVTLEGGALYLRGTVRGIAPASFAIPVNQIVTIGVRLIETVITELEDPTLRDPAVGTRNYQEPGAWRKKVEPVWGWPGDGQAGEFFPVYPVDNGNLRAKEAPPNLDSVNQALARYDRDSAGGTYVVSGLAVSALADLVTGEQVYSVAEGRARVNGYGFDLKTSRRLVYDTAPDLRLIDSEPHLSSTVAAQRINLDRSPVANISEVKITAGKTATLTHGGFTGAQDPLPDTSVLSILEVKQGGTTYVQGTDYKLTAGKVDWSLPGAEPAPGSTYTVQYQYIASVTPTAVDSTGFTVEGAVVGSLVLVTYNQKLPRYDRVAANSEGEFIWIKGISADWNPQVPTVPSDLLSLATIYQDWGDTRNVINDSVRVVPMVELSAINSRIDYVIGLVAQQRLEGSANLREATQKKGLFVDPFLDDSLRDAGTAQTGAIFSGQLTLPVTIEQVAQMPSDITAPTSLANNLDVALEQTSSTGSMRVNPYQAFDPIPAAVKLTPAVDSWTDVFTTWASATTERINIGRGNVFAVTSGSLVALVSSSSRPAEFLRQIDVKFSIAGFEKNEVLSSVTFDGVAVTATAL